jgi:hypothetical protein
MKVGRIIALGVPLVLTAAFMFSAPITLSQSTYTVRGQVVDVSGGWVPGASVRLYSAQGVLDLRADGDGKFEFKNLPTGTYELEGSSAGLITGTVDFEIAQKSPEPISILLNVWSCHICTVPQNNKDRIVAWVGVQVTYDKRSDKMDLVGVERDQFGSPLPAVVVKLVKESASLPTVSDEKGEFTFSGIEPGKYSLQSTHAGYRDLPATVWITREKIVRGAVTLVESWRICGG